MPAPRYDRSVRYSSPHTGDEPWKNQAANYKRLPCMHLYVVAASCSSRDTEKESDSRESRDYSRTLLPWLLCAKELVLTITNKETWNAPHQIDYRLLPVGCCRSNTARLTYHNLHLTVCELRNHRTRCAFIHAPGWGTELELEASSNRAMTSSASTGTTSGSQAIPPSSPDNKIDVGSTKKVGPGVLLVQHILRTKKSRANSHSESVK